MTYYAVIYLNPDTVRQYNEHMRQGKLDYDKLGYKTYETVETWSVTFPNKVAMDIKVCAGTRQYGDPLWSEGVLFTEHGSEIACTEVMDELDTEYEVMDRDDKYVVRVAKLDDRTERLFKNDHDVEHMMNITKASHGYYGILYEIRKGCETVIRAQIDSHNTFKFTTIERITCDHDRKITIERYSRPRNQD